LRIAFAFLQRPRGGERPTLGAMKKRIRVHDGIIGLLLTSCTALGATVDPRFFWLAGITGLIMVQSSFTGFCPVHYTLSKVLRDE
jgi:hypothetical protein